MALRENLEAVRQSIAERAERSGRVAGQIEIVAVTKMVPVGRIREAIALGLRTLGENRVQEAVPKIDEIGTPEVAWHLIGHLQTNKVKFIEGRFQMVQSVDRVELVSALDHRLTAPIEVLIEVNVAAEPQKTGAALAELPAIAEAVNASGQLRLRGLMTIAPLAADPEQARPIFRRLRSLRDQLGERLGMALPVLSMGMTDDFGVAVEEGSTMLRLGRALFGPR